MREKCHIRVGNKLEGIRLFWKYSYFQSVRHLTFLKFDCFIDGILCHLLAIDARF